MKELKKLLLVIFGLACFQQVFSQTDSTFLVINAQEDNTRFSVNLMQWLNKQNLPDTKNNNYALNTIGNIVYLSTIIKVDQDFVETEITKLGAYIGTKAGNIWTVMVPVQQIMLFIHLKGIDYIEMDRPVLIHMDSARYFTGVDSVHEGINLSLPISGKGVVVGVIDGGFDYTHPAFYDTSANVLRIKRIWDQRIIGSPPAGYTYGHEYTDTSAMLLKGYDISTSPHATHVAGIAAGSGFGSKNNRQYRGVAYESDLVFVTNPNSYLDWRNMTLGTIIDGINYIFTYAQSVGKPAVINLSEGSVLGPQDGSSLFSQACDNLSGPGKILVFSAGNSGQDTIHLKKHFSGTDTIVKTFVSIPDIGGGVRKNYLDIWGDSLNTFCIQFSLYHDSTESNSTAVFYPDNTTKNSYIIGSDKDTCFITLTSKSEDYNKRPHAAAEICCKTNDKLCLTITAANGEVNAWQEFFDSSWIAFYGTFKRNGNSWASSGDAEYTIGEVGCTKSVITVGGYVSKTCWKNLVGQTLYFAGNHLNELAPFSSHGPSIDGRMKPEITAPAAMVVAPFNSFDPEFTSTGKYNFLCVKRYRSPRNSRYYYYGALSGTSMAAPVVSGIAALMLQVNPTLAPADIKKIFYETAIIDSFTTPQPDDTRCGAGKINAYAAIKQTIMTAGTDANTMNPDAFRLSPNPNNGIFNLDYSAVKPSWFLVEIINTLGQLVSIHPWQVTEGNNQMWLKLDFTSKGIYIINILGSGKKVVKKMVVF